MNWVIILQLIWEVLKLIFKLPMAKRGGFLARLRKAKQVAEQTGDTRELEALLAELGGKPRP